jgi:histidine triad (HIT) family protein
MTDCLFCSIVNKKIPSHTVFENDSFIAFLDIHPVHVGHVLVVPKQHVETIEDLSAELAADLLTSIQHISKALRQELGAEGINIISNNGSVAGQVIFHAHVHIVPRFANDGLQHWPGKDASEEDLMHAASKLIKALE